jgi:tRNA dimethylallyltransferase
MKTSAANSGDQTGQPRTPAICLLGPTASGKTALAIELVSRLPCEIINVDSAQIYRDMDIGTGKPDAATLALAPHRLLSFLDPAQVYSASLFRADALREMADIRARGRIPLLVGGTMLYFKALRDGLASMPGADPLVREQITATAQALGWAAVHARLREVDPESAQRIHPNDPQRLQRALEIFLVSGKSMTQWHQESHAGQASGVDAFDLHFLSIQPRSRGVLHSRIAARFRRMLEQGLVEEVVALRGRGDLTLALPSMRAVGYRQVWQYIAGELAFDAMVEQGIISTRQLAKRQITWLRSWENLQDFDSENPETLELILKFVDRIAI